MQDPKGIKKNAGGQFPAPINRTARDAQNRCAKKPVRAEPASPPERAEVPARASAPPREPKAENAAPALGQPPAGAAPGAAELKSEWGRVVRLMREHGDKVTGALLNSCTVVGLEGQVLHLSTNEFVITKISSNSETRAVLDNLVSEVLGFACTVKFEGSGRASRSARTDDIPEDGLVATALDLGGEIVDE